MSISPRENMLRAYRHEIPDYLPLSEDQQFIRTPGAGLRTVVYDGKPAAQYSQRDGGLDWFGQNWIYEPVVNAINPDVSNYIVKDVTRWREYVTIPDVDAIDWKARFDAENIPVDRENKVIAIGDSIGMWERAFSMIKMDDLLTGLLLEPEAMHDFFDEIANHKIKLYNHYIDYYKPDIFRMNDDYGHGHGMFMSPDTWREIIKPHLKKIIDNVIARGVIYEHHCCGYMVPIVDDLIEMGVTAWNGCHVCNDPPECIERFGDRLAFNGGILNAQFFDAPSTTEEQIREHVRETASKIYPAGVIVGTGVTSHPERSSIVIDELLKSGQQYFKENRPN